MNEHDLSRPTEEDGSPSWAAEVIDTLAGADSTDCRANDSHESGSLTNCERVISWQE